MDTFSYTFIPFLWIADLFRGLWLLWVAMEARQNERYTQILGEQIRRKWRGWKNKRLCVSPRLSRIRIRVGADQWWWWLCLSRQASLTSYYPCAFKACSVQWLGYTHKQKGKSPEMKIIANIAYAGVVVSWTEMVSEKRDMWCVLFKATITFRKRTFLDFRFVVAVAGRTDWRTEGLVKDLDGMTYHY